MGYQPLLKTDWIIVYCISRDLIGLVAMGYQPLLKTDWIIVYCISRDLIGLAAMVYELLYHGREIVTIKFSSV